MPGAVPHTSTVALASTTIKYGLLIADYGIDKAIEIEKGLKEGINIRNGEIVNENLRESYKNY